jgi:tetratricopeptide (TPR) repeat protein
MSGSTKREERMACLSDLEVTAFLAGELTAGDLKRVTRHLLAGCPNCQGRVTAAAPVPDKVYDACIDRARRKVRRLEPRLQRDKERLANGVALVRERDWRGLTWSELGSFRMVHVEVLLELSFEERYRDPRKMLKLARKAQFAAEKKDHPARYGEPLFLDLRARVWAELGNAYRVNELFEQAEEALEKARSLAGQGTGDPMLAARIDDLEASLRKAQRRLDEAIRLHDRAFRAYMKIGERHLAGRTLLKKGISLELQQHPDEAIRTLKKALTLIDAGRDPKLHASAHHSALKTLVDAERYAEAGKLLLVSDLRRKFADDPLNLLRLRWIEAKILIGRERFGDAEIVLSEVRAGFLEHKLAYVAAMVGLDLAELLQRQDKDVRALAVDILARFEEHAVDPEAIDALTIYEMLCSKRLDSVTLTRNARNYLEHFQDKPASATIG